MALKLLQMDYSYSGPWGSEMAEEYPIWRTGLQMSPALFAKCGRRTRRREKRVGFICLRMKPHWILTLPEKLSG